MTLRYSKEQFSAAPGGDLTAVTVAATPGQVLHATRASGRSEFDAVELWAGTSNNVNGNLNVEIGTEGVAFRTVVNAPTLILSGHPLQAGRSLRVWGDANVIVWGHVDRAADDGA